MSPQPDDLDSPAPPPQAAATVTAKIRELVPAVTAVAGLAAGAAALAAVLLSVFSLNSANAQLRINNAQLRLNEEGQITDRFNIAVTHLGSSSLAVRLGGIYALQRIMQDSPPEEPSTIAVLCAFVRAHTSGATTKPQALGPPSDIQAALTVIVNRPHGHHPQIDLDTTVDLSGADLAYAQLPNAYLSYANLAGTNLANADLAGASLNHAILTAADLAHAILNGDTYLGYANLTRATLTRANLTSADLIHANLTGANFAHSIIRDTNLSDTKRAGTKGL
jgi:hypothetical protein